MFYSSLSRHFFDTMFVVLCVAAGAYSHTISNTSRKVTASFFHNLPKASFIDYLFDSNFIEIVQNNTISRSSHIAIVSNTSVEDHANEFTNERGLTVCSLLSKILNPKQVKNCLKHQDILEAILPKVSHLAASECTYITRDLTWNCSSMQPFLDQTKLIAYTREAALIRSIINASMMYLILKFCTEHNNRSCGCRPVYSAATSDEATRKDLVDVRRSFGSTNQTDIVQSHSGFLETGSALRLAGSTIKRQGCLANVAFADALTRTFLDSDDLHKLTKASKMLYEYSSLGRKNLKFGLHTDSDHKEVIFIKWSKAAVNLHNANNGRQAVRKTIKRQCRCHGLSGVCQFQTCWDTVKSFDLVSWQLRSSYRQNSLQVEVKNLGSSDSPDLHLIRMDQRMKSLFHDHINREYNLRTTESNATLAPELKRFGFETFIYLYEGPDYCNPHPQVEHLGTRGRFCTPSSMAFQEKSMGLSSMNESYGTTISRSYYQSNHYEFGTGECGEICCNRGYESELVLRMYQCNCRFRFCCSVECDSCLNQQILHHCL